MVERVNRGDKEALRELMSRCTRPMYDRAMELTGDVYAAKDAVRRALREMAEAARRGECPENAEEWAVMLAQRCCDEEMYYKRLIDSMIEGLPLTSRTAREDCAAQRSDERPEQAEPLSSYAPERDPAFEQTPAGKPLIRSIRAMPGSAEAGEPAREREEERAEEAHEDIFAPPKPRRSRVMREEVPDLFSEEAAPRDEYDDDDYDEDQDEMRAKGGGVLALLIIVLTVVAAGLLWVIAVKFMKLGYFNMSDFGFADWFNEHLFKFY